MTIKVESTTHAEETPKAETDAKSVDESKQSAPETKDSPEQKESTESGTEETEGKEEKLDESESDEETEESKDAEKEKPKKKSGFQRRIDKLNARETVQRERADRLEAELAALKASKQDAKVESPKAEAGEPNPDDFEDHRSYVRAVAKYEAQQLLKEEKAKTEKSELESSHAAQMKAHFDRVKTFADKTSDWEDALAEVEDIQFSPTAQDVITSSELGPELIYELAKNRQEAERIAKLPPLAAARELGRLEAKILSRTSEAKEPKKTTNAPKPINPTGSKGGAVERNIYDPNISQADYERVRMKQRESRTG